MSILPDIQAVLSGESQGCVVCARAEDVLPTLPDGSVDLIAVDPPYFRVKSEPWDRQWDTTDGFIGWLGALCQQWQRILKQNGSLYCFASPKMAARVEVEIGKWFNVLNQIVWLKDDGAGGGRHCHACKEELRSFFPRTERIIFAEHVGADNTAKGEAGYIAKCDELRGFVFEPLRAYLADEMQNAGFNKVKVNAAWQAEKGGNGGMASHWFSTSQWALPTHRNYKWLRALFNAGGDGHLRREYEDLRREYEDLRRPFAVTADVAYTDVWEFATVPGREGKHVCEKPMAIMEHIVRSSTREKAVVVDCMAGSGSTLQAAKNLGRRYIGVELDPKWANRARRRLAATPRPLFQPEAKRAENPKLWEDTP